MNQELGLVLRDMGMSEIEIQQLVFDMEQTSGDWLLLSLLQELPESVTKELDVLLQQGRAPQDVTEFLHQKIPGLDTRLTEKLLLFQQELATNLKQILAAEQSRALEQSNLQHHQPKIETTVKKKEAEIAPVETLSPAKARKEFETLGRDIKNATKKGDWSRAAQAMQRRKEVQALLQKK